MMGDMKECIGKEIVSYRLNDDGTEMVLTFSDGSAAIFAPEGECCSHSWIESIDDETVLRGKVLGIEDIDMPDLGNVDGERHKGVQEVRYYGMKITTEHGRAVVDYRNDSNGYYGGWLNFRMQVAP